MIFSTDWWMPSPTLTWEVGGWGRGAACEALHHPPDPTPYRGWPLLLWRWVKSRLSHGGDYTRQPRRSHWWWSWCRWSCEGSPRAAMMLTRSSGYIQQDQKWSPCGSGRYLVQWHGHCFVKVRLEVQETIHAAHQGASGMISRVEDTVFWPGICSSSTGTFRRPEEAA